MHINTQIRVHYISVDVGRYSSSIALSGTVFFSFFDYFQLLTPLIEIF